MIAQTQSQKRHSPVILTRSARDSRSVRTALNGFGVSNFCLPAFSFTLNNDEQTRALLMRSVRSKVVIFTSVQAVRAAFILCPTLVYSEHVTVLAPGAATARALRRRGIKHAQAPLTRVDAEGILQHSSLQSVRNQNITLITAPGGRAIIETQLRNCGAHVNRIDVYQRSVARWNKNHQHVLMRYQKKSARIVITSEAAIISLRARLDSAIWQSINQHWCMVVSSDRLALIAARNGFTRIIRARSALNRDLLAALQK